MEIKTARKLAKRNFISDEGGSAFMIFGLAFVPVMFVMGAATDYTRLTITRAALQQATDAAVLAVASKMAGDTNAQQAQAQAQVVLNSNPRLANATITNATISSDKQTFCATSQMSVPNVFMQMTGIANMSAGVTSCANLAGGVAPNTSYEIALVLDNSGSMSNSTNGQTKLAALKTAASSFIDTMFTKAPNKVGFSVVPFAGGVVAVDPTVSSNRSLSWIDTLGSNAQHWAAFGGKTAANAAGFTSRFDIYAKLKQRNSQLDWRGCFEEPPYPLNVNADSMTPGTADSLMVPYLAPDEPDGSYYYGNSYLNDNGASGGYYSSGSQTCSGSVSGAWNNLTHVCKYQQTASLSGSFGPSAFYGPNQFCPSNATQTILQLNTSQSIIKNKINQLVANGNTNLHTGFMWGWRSIGPSLPFGGGRGYGAAANRKIMVFMTDGFNNWGAQTNTVVGSDYESLGYYTNNGAANPRLPDGSAGDGVNYQTALAASANKSSSYLSTSRKALDGLTLEACTNAKLAGVEVFTIGFSIPTDPIDTQGLNLLKACATNTDHYFAATDASQLNAAFSQIGIGLGKLRLSQ